MKRIISILLLIVLLSGACAAERRASLIYTETSYTYTAGTVAAFAEEAIQELPMTDADYFKTMSEKPKTEETTSILTASESYFSVTSPSSESEETTSIVTTSESVSSSEEISTEKSESTVQQPVNVTLLNLKEMPFPDLENVKAQYAEKRAAIENEIKDISEQKNAPVIYITTENSRRIDSEDEYTAAVIDLFNCDDKYVLSEAGGVRVRGNTTAAKEGQKPYRIKFEKKQNLLGLHNGEKYKNWVLLRTTWSLIPDYLALNLFSAISENRYYSSDCCFVNLYINGEFTDVYLLCEQNQAKRMGISEPAADDYSLETGYLIEMDNYPSDEHPHFRLKYSGGRVTDMLGEARRVPADEFSIKTDINTKEQCEFIEKYSNGVWDILYNAVQNDTAYMFDENYDIVPAPNLTPRQAAESVLDMESAVDMYILEELVCNNDIGTGSFYLAVDFSENSIYPKLTMLSPWDFNWAYDDNPMSFFAGAWQKIVKNWDKSNGWFVLLMSADWFRDMVIEKWSVIRSDGIIESATDEAREKASYIRGDLAKSSWRADGAKKIADYVCSKAEWLDGKWSE